MVNLEELKKISLLIESIDVSLNEINKAYEKKDIEKLELLKKNILDSQKNISKILNRKNEF